MSMLSDCQGKERYGDKALAERVLRRRKRSGKLGVLKVYRCPHCAGWHHGNELRKKP